ncbi:hypothetical protein [Pelagicoccus mobilis]|uniref:DUF1425 domain-containing protein n=1 Tax=Pelagicoccus mobilis TaxID=415221 RepID=A0A934RV92_9BACT|nr:hypothetical protein [Pelagicoccus mobilis]MBK1875774.1 hypothetical protein [Pelagicoccus mobilis]
MRHAIFAFLLLGSAACGLAKPLSLFAEVVDSGVLEHRTDGVLSIGAVYVVKASVRNYSQSETSIGFDSCSWYELFELSSENLEFEIVPWDCLSGELVHCSLSHGEILHFRFFDKIKETRR